MKWISVWNPTYVRMYVVIHMYVIRGGFLWGSTKKSVGSLDGCKCDCGEPAAKRMTGLFYPRSASLGLSGPVYVCIWPFLGLSGPQPASQPDSSPASQTGSDSPKETQRGTERPREAQRGPAQRGPETPRRPRQAQRGSERPREAQRGPERPRETRVVFTLKFPLYDDLKTKSKGN